eukprot:ANDGO_05322.mRNA.1 hypothetical protein
MHPSNSSHSQQFPFPQQEFDSQLSVLYNPLLPQLRHHHPHPAPDHHHHHQQQQQQQQQHEDVGMLFNNGDPLRDALATYTASLASIASDVFRADYASSKNNSSLPTSPRLNAAKETAISRSKQVDSQHGLDPSLPSSGNATTRKNILEIRGQKRGPTGLFLPRSAKSSAATSSSNAKEKKKSSASTAEDEKNRPSGVQKRSPARVPAPAVEGVHRGELHFYGNDSLPVVRDHMQGSSRFGPGTEGSFCSSGISSDSNNRENDCAMWMPGSSTHGDAEKLVKACVLCRMLKRKCSGSIPCVRCTARGCPDQCTFVPRRKRSMRSAVFSKDVGPSNEKKSRLSGRGDGRVHSSDDERTSCDEREEELEEENTNVVSNDGDGVSARNDDVEEMSQWKLKQEAEASSRKAGTLSSEGRRLEESIHAYLMYANCEASSSFSNLAFNCITMAPSVQSSFSTVNGSSTVSMEFMLKDAVNPFLSNHSDLDTESSEKAADSSKSESQNGNGVDAPQGLGTPECDKLLEKMVQESQMDVHFLMQHSPLFHSLLMYARCFSKEAIQAVCAVTLSRSRQILYWANRVGHRHHTGDSVASSSSSTSAEVTATQMNVLTSNTEDRVFKLRLDASLAFLHTYKYPGIVVMADGLLRGINEPMHSITICQRGTLPLFGLLDCFTPESIPKVAQLLYHSVVAKNPTEFNVSGVRIHRVDGMPHATHTITITPIQNASGFTLAFSLLSVPV